jgi:lysophospholipase L1-like esterase
LPVLIGRRVADATGRRVRVAGYGVSGARTATLTSDQLPRVDGAYDALVLVIGSNDATHATPWWRFGEQTIAMLEGATRLGAPVVLAGTPRFSGTRIIPEPLRTMVDTYSAVLRREQRAAAAGVPGVSFVDLAADASPRFAGVPEATSSDGFHPSPIGYGFWADAISPSVVAALARAG